MEQQVALEFEALSRYAPGSPFEPRKIRTAPVKPTKPGPPTLSEQRETLILQMVELLEEPLTDAMVMLADVHIFNRKTGWREVVTEIAERYVDRMLDPYDETAGEVGRRVLALSFGANVIPPEFWRQPIGQLIVDADGFPFRDASRVEAAAVLQVSPEFVRQQANLYEPGNLEERRNTTQITRASLMRVYRKRAKASARKHKKEVDHDASRT